MKKILKNIWILSIFLLCGCTKQVYIPTDTKHIIEYRDSLIYLTDTLVVEIPKEIVKEIKPVIDTSRLETKIAFSEAYVDTVDMTLHHTLKNKPNSLKTAIDTVFVVKTKTEYLEKPVIVEVEKPVKYVPKIYKYSLWFSIGVLLFIGLKIYLKFKGM